jgi:hypothetical protein
MSSEHRQLPLDEVVAGMVLSDNVLDDNGVVLLSRGLTLSTSILAALARHGIETVPVAGESPAAEQASPDPDQQQQRLAQLFRKQSLDEASGLLYQYVQFYRLGESA